METYTAMRQFADSWMLLAMTIFFVAVVARVLLSASAKRDARDAARIPFNDYDDEDRRDG